MLNALSKNKLGKTAFHYNEDALTSFVFERLTYLPVDIFHVILYKIVPKLKLEQLENFYEIEYWPHWSSENISNKNYIEPDVFMRFNNIDIIFEAKRYDEKQQNPDQWKDQITAYHSDYADEKKKLIYVAIGGIHSLKQEEIWYEGKRIYIYKCKWTMLLQSIKSTLKEIETASSFSIQNKAILNILNDCIEVFRAFGFLEIDWFESLLHNTTIDNNSLQILNNGF